MVAIERRALEPVYTARGEQVVLAVVGLQLLLLLVGSDLIFGIEHHCPAGRERRVRLDVAGLEEETAEDRRYCEILAVGQVDDVDRRHDDVGGVEEWSRRERRGEPVSRRCRVCFNHTTWRETARG